MKAFTLVELVLVIVLLGVIGLIVIPQVGGLVEDNKESLYNRQLDEIELSAEKWGFENLDLLPAEGETKSITLFDLKKGGYIELDLRNPKDGELFPNDMNILITQENNKYVYFVDGTSGTKVDSDFNINAPTIVLNGKNIEYVEINDIYNEQGATAVNTSGETVTTNVQYKYNDTEIGSIPTNEFKTYTATYSATYNGYTSYIIRTIVVRDTTPPVITIPKDIVLNTIKLENFNLLVGASATDNSGEAITINTSGYNNLYGKHIVSYTACDSNNNCDTKKRIVTIAENVVELTNLVTNSSIENGMEGWAAHYGDNVMVSNEQYKFGQYSAKNNFGDQYAAMVKWSIYSNGIPAIANHQYYFSGWNYTKEKGDGVCYIDFGFTYDSMDHWGYNFIQDNINVWEKFSRINVAPNASSIQISLALADTNSTTKTQECYSDGVMIIDLTAAFGSGNEPSKEWCDNHIEYFDGTKSLAY